MKWYDLAREEMRNQRMTYTLLGDKLGITESAIGHYLNGRREPSIAQILSIAEHLALDPCELINGQALPELERKLLRQFRTLDHDQKQLAVRLICQISEKQS